MTRQPPLTGVVLFAHGSRDPQWRTPVEAIAAQVHAIEPAALVTCAYLELCEPSLPTAMDTLASAGVQRIRILPVFFGMGKHAREDLPLLVQQWSVTHPDTAIDILPAAGEHAALTDLLAHVALGLR